MWFFVLVLHSVFITFFSYSHLSKAVTPKLAQNWQKNVTPNLWKAFGSKDFWNPSEKVWYIDISFTSWTMVKIGKYLFGENLGSMVWPGLSKLSLKIRLQKETPHRSQGSTRQERKETWITERNNSWEVKTISSPFWVQSLSWCVSIQVNLIWKDTYLWTCTKLKQNQFPFRFFTETFKTENVIHQPTRYIFHKTLQCEVPSLAYIQFINSLPKSGGMVESILLQRSVQDPGEGGTQPSILASKLWKFPGSFKGTCNPYLISKWQSLTDFSGSWLAPDFCLFKGVHTQRKYSIVFFHVWNTR